MEKTLLVLGASSDMGMKTIRELREEYDCIFAHYRSMSTKLQELQDEIGSKLIYLQGDFSLTEDVLRCIDTIRQSGKIPTHIVHFPAPLCDNAKFHKIPWETFQREMDISLRSIILVLQAFLPLMAKQRYGRVVLMLSFVVSGTAPAYCCNYVVTKYALLGLVKSLASEYASKGITVNGISPSWVNTKYISNQPNLLIEKNRELSPLGRMLEPEDIVPSIRFLFSDGASCINGQNISITCGR